MTGKAFSRRGIAGLWLLAILAGTSAAAENLHIVGPGVVVMRQYRPGVTLYSPNTYNYIQPNPYIYGPLTGTRVQIYSPPRVQPYAMPPTPYREYYTPHIPRYYRRQDPNGPPEAPGATRRRDAKGARSLDRESTAEPQAAKPPPGEPERIEPESPAPSPSIESDQLSPPADERPRKATRRRPTRYR